MPMADFVRYVDALPKDRESFQSLAAGLADAAALRAYAAARGIDLSEAEARAFIEAGQSQLTDDQLDGVSGGRVSAGGGPEGLARVLDIFRHAIVPSLDP